MRYLVRCNVPPLEYHTPIEVIRKNLVGNNSGNLLYQYSVVRSLLQPGTELGYVCDSQLLKGEVTAETISRDYDHLILPFANAFREDFQHILKAWTAVVRKLKIPVTVVGIGLQDKYEPTYKDGFSFDGTVKDFVSALLDHSASIGVRGEYTEDYLHRLGFGQNQVSLIGCPSMFMFGWKLPVREKKPLTHDSVIGITGAVGNPREMKKFLMKVREEYPDYYYIPQLLPDLELIYGGKPFLFNPNARILYPNMPDHPDFVKDKALYFINAVSMMRFMPKIDFDIGSRFHGGVSAVLCGVPTLFMPMDARVRELTAYHELNQVPGRDITSGMKLEDLYADLDPMQPLKHHRERADRYFTFLEKEGIKTVFRRPEEGEKTGFSYPDEMERQPLDDLADAAEICPPVHAIATTSGEELAARLSCFGKYRYDSESKPYEEAKKSLAWYRKMRKSYEEKTVFQLIAEKLKSRKGEKS